VKQFIIRFSPHRNRYIQIRNLLGFWPGNIRLYELAFTHSSVAREIRDGLKDSNERLEFLGDAVLGTIVARFLFVKFPYRDEGFLTEMRSRIVNRMYLNKLAIKIGIDKLIQYDASHRVYKSICGDTFEALIGAIYLDKGYNFTERVVLERIIRFHVDLEELEQQELNFKSRLINQAQRNRQAIVFDAREETSGERQKRYHVTVFIDEQPVAEGIGYSKKAAEQAASEQAWTILNPEKTA
jgi:ribonuclease-3